MRTLLFTMTTAFLLGLTGCKKQPDLLPSDQADTPTSNSDDLPGVVTEVGKPIGAPITQTIGSAGGNIVTADGKYTLVIPSGALSKTTTLTLQPVENKAPSGAGMAFTIEPKDTKLNKPVSWVWHYSNTDMSGSAPEVVGFAYQDAKGVWQGTLNNQVDKAKQTITARARNFAHPMAWYEQYYMTPQETTILPNDRVGFTVYFEPGRTRHSPNPDDEIFVPLPNPEKGDNALRELEKQELRNWKLNGEINLSEDQQQVIGTLDRLGQGGGATYTAPRAMVPNTANPKSSTTVLAVSVELNLKQTGVITLVSNMTMTDPENDFKIGGKSYKNPFVQAISESGGLSVNIDENVPRNAQFAHVNFVISKELFSGAGTYVFDSKTKGISCNAFDKKDSYGIEWVPEPNRTEYGPVTIIISEFTGTGLPVAGRISATLHNYIEKEKRWEHVSVSGRFRIIDNYKMGG